MEHRMRAQYSQDARRTQPYSPRQKGSPVMNFKGLTVLIMDAKPRPAVRAKVKEKVESGECLLCSEKAAPGRRGLCQLHYGRFHRAMKDFAKADRPAEEAKKVRDGELLPDRQGQRSENEFRESAYA